MTLHQWHNSWLYSLMMYSISIVVICLPFIAAGLFVGWYDETYPEQQVEHCIETSRGATVCGELVR